MQSGYSFCILFHKSSFVIFFLLLRKRWFNLSLPIQIISLIPNSNSHFHFEFKECFLGNDIARRSFKRLNRSTKPTKTETNVTRQSTLIEESEVLSISNKGSQTNLNKMQKELSNISLSNDDKDKEREDTVSNDIGAWAELIVKVN